MSEKLTNELASENLEDVNGGVIVLEKCGVEVNDALELGTDDADGDATLLDNASGRSTGRERLLSQETIRGIV